MSINVSKANEQMEQDLPLYPERQKDESWVAYVENGQDGVKRFGFHKDRDKLYAALHKKGYTDAQLLVSRFMPRDDSPIEEYLLNR